MELIKCKQSLKINKIALVEEKTIKKMISFENNSCYMLYVVEKGDVEIKCPSFNGIVEQGKIILIAPFEQYSLTPINDKSTVITTQFECNNPHLVTFTKAPFPVSMSIQNHLIRAMKESSFLFIRNNSYDKGSEKTVIPFGAEQLLVQDLEYFLIILIRKSMLSIDFKEAKKHPYNFKSELASQIVEYIDNHITENLNNFSICKQFGISKTTLCKIFRENQGCTVIKYINQAKIQVAKNMIREGKLNFTEIAEKLSYSSIHYFCKMFVSYERMTPTEYSKIVTKFIEEGNN